MKQVSNNLSIAPELYNAMYVAKEVYCHICDQADGRLIKHVIELVEDEVSDSVGLNRLAVWTEVGE